MIRARRFDPEAPKPVKFKVSTETALRLHTLRIVAGRPISEIVVEALDVYFAQPRGA